MKLFFSHPIFACVCTTVLLAAQPVLPAAESKQPAATEQSTSKGNKRVVKVYAGPEKKSVYVWARETDGKKIDFFVFDLEGTLMKHFKMQTGDREKISGLEKGKYVYSVFAGDEETANGEFNIH